MSTANSFKLCIDKKILGVLKICAFKDVPIGGISKLLQYGFNDSTGKINLRLPYKAFRSVFPQATKEDFHSLLKIPCDEVVTNVKTDSSENIVFDLNQQKFTEDLLLNKCSLQCDKNVNCKNIVIDYSSPNIAKPFHMGHLRSTIIGNFLANLYEHLGHNVTRLTYLGDWGTQFGLLQVGLQQPKFQDLDLSANPMQQLFNAYVEGNALAEANQEVAAEARKIFSHLEAGGESAFLEKWKKIKKLTVADLTKTYARLGVTFDQYHWESSYNARACMPILKVLEDNHLLEDEDGKKMITLENGRRVPLLKSDGSSLYLTRDVAAALDRWVTHRCDRLLYVVDNSQNQHFTALRGVLDKLQYDWASGVEHVKFGRIQGMSTRKGNVIFLKDILDEAKLRMAEKQRQSQTTKNYSEEVSDILGVSAIIVNDLKQRRMKDYSFDWTTTLQSEGDTGVKLQYTHCRLWSLQEVCGQALPDHCDHSLLSEPEARAVILEIARFEEAVERANSKLEAYEIVNYLFRLCNKTSQALKTLNVKHQPAALAEQRLLLFQRARKVLHSGLKLLGLRPLTEM